MIRMVQRNALAISLLFFSTLLFAAPPITLHNVTIKPGPTSSSFIFTLSGKTTGKVKYLPNQKQLQVEFVNTTTRLSMNNAQLQNANVISITTQRLPENGLRFVLMVKDKIRWKIQFRSQKNQTAASLQLEVISINTEQKTTLSKSPRLFTVVIDAGHGGKDWGAIGQHGTTEKHIALAIAKQLAAEINRQPNMRAILTRNGDYFVPLRERLKLARKGAADLFVAIHADAYFDNNASGVSVYALSNRGATTEAARWLAQRENYSELDNVELNALQDRSTQLRSVLIDLAQTITIRDSLRLGNKLLDALDDISLLHYKRVQQAPFVVLKSPDIPSILVETGFITNPREEERLTEKNYQQKLAHALLQGITQYVKNNAALE